MATSERAWCYYRNLVQTVYRESRHLGGPGDAEAKLHVNEPSLAAVLANITKWRPVLKSTRLFEKIAHTTRTAAIRKPYEEVTGLRLEQLSDLFADPGWTRSYGGEKWERITQLTIDLGRAIDDGDAEQAEATCDRVSDIEHNTGPLVPRTRAQQNSEKWPVLCDPVAD